MNPEEENLALRAALAYANNAITLITLNWVHEKHMTQIAKILEHIQELTPPTRQ